MVKCAGCGFLAVRNVETRELDSPAENYRSDGTIPTSLIKHARLLHEERPICLVRSPAFPYHPSSEAPDTPHRKAIVQQEHDCKLWDEWQIGFTPKEHREMLDRQWMFELEEERRQSDRRWHIAELIIFGAAGALVAVIAALIGRGTI